jgi:hypothetical protein
MNLPQRLHALDNLRAVMMWLGIVLHAAVNHITGNAHLPWRDQETSLGADVVMLFIHSFRMPVFFMMGGFFVAMLASRRGYGGMLRHRLRRIALPFAVFWPPVFVGMSVLVMLYVHLMVRGTLGLDETIMPVDPERPVISTMHMWFMYYLFWFCVITALLGSFSGFVPEGVKSAIAKCWFVLASKWWGCLVLVVPLVVAGSAYQWGVVTSSGSFILRPTEFLHNGMFFVSGLFLYRHREILLDLYAKYCWRYALAGLVFFVVYLALADHYRFAQAWTIPLKAGFALIYNLVTWMWCFALIGLFIRYLPNQNRFLRYVSESSYWVYLVHMLGTIGFGVLLYHAPFGVAGKMAINILATTLVCIVSYQVLVRYTPISTLLNGHRYRFGDGERLDKKVSVA